MKEFLYVTECTKLGFFGAKIAGIFNYSIGWEKMWNASRICVSSLRRGHANLLCIVPILVYVLPKQVHLQPKKYVIIYFTSRSSPKTGAKKFGVD